MKTTHETPTLTPAQMNLFRYLRDGGKITRHIESLPGRGYFAEGIKMLLPATVKTLQDLDLLVLEDQVGDEEIFLWTGNELEDVGIFTDDDPATYDKTEPEATPQLVEEDSTHLNADDLPTPASKAQDYLMWVGESHYPRIADFIDEAEVQGVSKRVGRFPASLLPGISRIYLAHDEGQRDRGVIFGYFTVTSLDILDIDPTTPLPVYNRNDITYYGPEDLAAEGERGCGRRDEHGARYVTAMPNLDLDAVRKIGVGLEAHGPLVVFEQPVLTTTVGISGRFRSFVKVDRDAIDAAERTDKYPYEAAQEELDIPELAGLQVDPTKRWTEEQRDALRAMVERYDSPFRAISDFATATGRSKAGTTYQWYNRLRPADQEDL